MTIKRFEDLISWQKARELTKAVYQITKQAPFKYDRGLVSQIQRAAVSAMANQAEGFTRGTKIELINYFYIAKGSAGEVQSHLYAALDAEYIDMSKFRYVYGLADEVQRLIESFVQKVKVGSRKGIQYKAGLAKESFLERVILENIQEAKDRGEDTTDMEKSLEQARGFPRNM